MRHIPIETLTKISELAVSSLSDEEYESGVIQLVGDLAMARRIIDWLPEAFGLILISHMGDIKLPKTFRVRNRAGEWVEIPFSKEPIFADALEFASLTYHNGPKHIFKKLAVCSSVVDAVNKALNAGESLDSAKLGPITMMDLFAETYDSMA
jgi:hypothetical protein